MLFVNEYIPESDYAKYDLRRICGDHNRVHRGHMHSRAWTVDRDGDAFLIPLWWHRDSDFAGWAFYWRGEWLFFEVRGMGGGGLRPDGSCWFGYRVRKFQVPDHLQEQREQVVADLTRAFGDYCGGGVFSSYKRGAASLEFE